MPLFNFLLIIILSVTIISCGSNTNSKKNDFSINSSIKGKSITNNETLSLSINNQKNLEIDSIVYSLNGKQITAKQDLKSIKLGEQIIDANIYYEGKNQVATLPIIIVNSDAPKVFTYNIINEYPHDIKSYTQGLEFFNDTLYESTGQLGESKLRKLDYKTGKVLNNINLANEYFGEGLTVLNNNIYQLTWQSNIGFVYDIETFKKKSSFKYGKSKEGWGLCNNGNALYKSDGTENIWILNANTLAEKEKLQVYTNKGKIGSLNELEWIKGKIYANIYQRNGVAIINPKNGAVEGVIDFSPLKKLVKQHQGLDVLNGIAYNSVTNTIFVTGKRWDKLFEVEIIEKE